MVATLSSKTIAVAGVFPLAFFIVALASSSWTLFAYKETIPYGIYQYGLFYVTSGQTGTVYAWTESLYCGDQPNDYPSDYLCANVAAAKAFTVIATIACGAGVILAAINQGRIAGILFAVAAVTGAVGFGVWNAGVHYYNEIQPANNNPAAAVSYRQYGHAQMLDLVAWCLCALIAVITLTLSDAQSHLALGIFSVSVPVILYIVALATSFWTIISRSGSVTSVGIFYVFTWAFGPTLWTDQGLCSGDVRTVSSTMCDRVQAAQAFTVMATIFAGLATVAIFTRNKFSPFIFLAAGIFGMIGFGIWNGGVHYSDDIGDKNLNRITGYSQVMDIIAWSACYFLAVGSFLTLREAA